MQNSEDFKNKDEAKKISSLAMVHFIQYKTNNEIAELPTQEHLIFWKLPEGYRVNLYCDHSVVNELI